MPVTIGWHEIALRLALATLAGATIGLDRGEHGRPAGLRTTLLVCLAAAIAMLQANLLMPSTGKASDSFVVLDLMRLPLGILTGVGFIGAGAVLRRDGLVIGLTTAATLWFVTVVGLCFGGGQIGLGIGSWALGVLVLSGLRHFDHHLKQENHASLYLTTERDEPNEEAIRNAIEKSGYKIIGFAMVGYANDKQRRELEIKMQWREEPQRVSTPPFLRELLNDPHIQSAEWKVS